MEPGIPIIPPSAFLTVPPFLSFNSIEGSVVSIFTIGLNWPMIYSLCLGYAKGTNASSVRANSNAGEGNSHHCATDTI